MINIKQSSIYSWLSHGSFILIHHLFSNVKYREEKLKEGVTMKTNTGGTMFKRDEKRKEK